MGTDRYAYQSRLRRVSPMPKLLLTAVSLVLCLCCDSIAVGLATLAGMGVLTRLLGGLSPRVYLHFLKIPLAFLLIGSITILIHSYPEGTAVLAAVPVGGRLWGFDAAALRQASTLFCKAMGAVACMYFLTLNTPVTDVTMALEKLHVPRLLVELMELIYRFIFLLAGEAGRIRTAQESRLGYRGFRRSLGSMGELLSTVFVRSLRRGERVFSALESRGYTGTLTTLPGQYVPGRWLYGLAAATAACQLLILLAERRLLP